MKTELRKRIVEKSDLIFIADDGTEFRDEYSCKRYEAGIDPVKSKVESMVILPSMSYKPFAWGAVWSRSDENCIWYKVKTQEDLDLLAKYACAETMDIEYTGEVVCLCGKDTKERPLTIVGLKDIFVEIEWFAREFGYDVVFTKKETE